MAQVSSAVTGGVTFTLATIQPVVEWVMQGMPHPVPQAVSGFIAAGVLTVGHYLVNRFVKGAGNEQA